MVFNLKFDERFIDQKLLDVDFGPISIIEPKYYIYPDKSDSIWTKKPTYPIFFDNFMESCVNCGGGILLTKAENSELATCVFRFIVSLPYETQSITFKGVGSPINDIPLNIKPYVNKLKKEWMEKLPYRPLEWKKWKPIVLN